MQRQHSSLPLLGKIAIIIGGSRGIGAGIVIELAARGSNAGSENPYLTLETEYARSL
jgi:hypothetical protein